MAGAQNGAAPTRPDTEILTLSEIAAYFRVTEQDILSDVTSGIIPVLNIGGEKRFILEDTIAAYYSRISKESYEGWRMNMMLGEFRQYRMALKKELSVSAEPMTTSPVRGSKEALQKHFGIFKDDDDLEERLAQLRRMRETDWL